MSTSSKTLKRRAGRIDLWHESEMYQLKLNSLVFESGLEPPGGRSKGTNTRNLLVESFKMPPEGNGPNDTAWNLQLQNCFEKWNITRLWDHFRSAAERDDTIYEDDEYPLCRGEIDESYRTDVPYHVTPMEMRGLLSGDNQKAEDFLKAEGQLMRCAVTTDEHATRVVALKFWCVLVAHQFSVGTVMSLVKGIGAVEVAHDPSSCAQGADDFLKGFCRYNSLMMNLEGLWTYCFKCVIDIRSEFWWDSANLIRLCGLHGKWCRSAHGLTERDGLNPPIRRLAVETSEESSDEDVVTHRRRLK